MHLSRLIITSLSTSLLALPKTPAPGLWQELKTKREKLLSLPVGRVP